MSFSVKPKTIHVGWKLAITPEVKSALAPIVGEELAQKLSRDPTVAVLYQTTGMEEWYRQKSAGPRQTVYIRGVFLGEKKRHVVAHVTIGTVHQWVIMYKETEIHPWNLRKEVSRGALGKEIPIDRIEVKAEPYIFQTCTHGVRLHLKCSSCEWIRLHPAS